MLYLLIGIACGVAVAAFLFVKRSGSAQPAPLNGTEGKTSPPAPGNGPSVTGPAPDFTCNVVNAAAILPTRWDIPEELVVFRRTEAFELPFETHRALMDRIVRIPRPPVGLQKLLSPGFLEQASPDDLSELILAEPHLAAKVLATVNSPFHGLPKPVTSVVQGVTYLGLNTIRSICLQCLMSEALRPTDPRLKPVFERWSHASAIASQLCIRLGQRVGVPDPGSMATLVVLSFLGHMAALSLLPAETTIRNAALGFLERTRREQEELGLCAGELGCLMMNQWGMPPAIVEDVRIIDRILTTAPKQLDAERGLRPALSYYCARVGEKLASGEWKDLEPAIPETLQGPEFFHLQTHFMIRPRMTQLAVDFRDPAFVGEVAAMVRALRAA
ncbi:MAG: hypothetical protein RLZZ591_2050 [Pseudomonadota bacterium]